MFPEMRRFLPAGAAAGWRGARGAVRQNELLLPAWPEKTGGITARAAGPPGIESRLFDFTHMKKPAPGCAPAGKNLGWPIDIQKRCSII